MVHESADKHARRRFIIIRDGIYFKYIILMVYSVSHVYGFQCGMFNEMRNTP